MASFGSRLRSLRQFSEGFSIRNSALRLTVREGRFRGVSRPFGKVKLNRRVHAGAYDEQVVPGVGGWHD